MSMNLNKYLLIILVSCINVLIILDLLYFTKYWESTKVPSNIKAIGLQNNTVELNLPLYYVVFTSTQNK